MSTMKITSMMRLITKSASTPSLSRKATAKGVTSAVMMSAIEVTASQQLMKREVGRMIYHGALSRRGVGTREEQISRQRCS